MNIPFGQLTHEVSSQEASQARIEGIKVGLLANAVGVVSRTRWLDLVQRSDGRLMINSDGSDDPRHGRHGRHGVGARTSSARPGLTIGPDLVGPLR